MRSFQDKEEYTIEDIQSLIDNEVEESFDLEFKAAGALNKDDKTKAEISKDVSAFANSDGGIIIYGLKERNHKAAELSFIDGTVYTKEWLELVISRNIKRRVPDVLIYPIRNNQNFNESIYVIKIPKSFEGPHMAKQMHFYKRLNTSTVMMEEYEIRQLYGQRVKSKLEIQNYGSAFIEDREDGSLEFVFEIRITNTGSAPESEYKTCLYLYNTRKEIDYIWNDKFFKCTLDSLPEGNTMKISSKGEMTLYPLEETAAMRLKLLIPFTLFDAVSASMTLKIELYYSNGYDVMEGDFKNLADLYRNANKWLSDI